MILEMPFFSFNNVNLQFSTKKLIWRTYIAAEAILIVKQVKLIDKHKFVKAVLDENPETFVMHITILEVLAKMMIHYF